MPSTEITDAPKSNSVESKKSSADKQDQEEPFRRVRLTGLKALNGRMGWTTKFIKEDIIINGMLMNGKYHVVLDGTQEPTDGYFWPKNCQKQLTCDIHGTTYLVDVNLKVCDMCSFTGRSAGWVCKNVINNDGTKCFKINYHNCLMNPTTCTKCNAFPPGNWECEVCEHINQEGLEFSSHDALCTNCLTTKRSGRTAGFFERYLITMDALQRQEWIEMRAHNLQLGMSANYCLTRKDCGLRVQSDLAKAPGPIARKVIFSGIVASFCASISLFGTVVFFLLNFCVVQNVSMTVGRPIVQKWKYQKMLDLTTGYTFNIPQVDTAQYRDPYTVHHDHDTLMDISSAKTACDSEEDCVGIIGWEYRNRNTLFSLQSYKSAVGTATMYKLEEEIVEYVRFEKMSIVCPGFTFTPPNQDALDIITNQIQRSPSVLLLLKPQTITTANMSDSHCWDLEKHKTSASIDRDELFDGDDVETMLINQSNFLVFIFFPLVVYATVLGLFVGIQELLNLSPAGHRCTKLVVKDRYCTNGCIHFCSKLDCRFSHMTGMILGEFFYYLTFVSAYTATMNLFLTMGKDLAGYDQSHVYNSEYKG